MHSFYLISPSPLVPTQIAYETIKYICLSSAYAGSLVIPLGLLLLFCPKRIRKTPIFSILTINLILGIILAFLCYLGGTRVIKNPFQSPDKRYLLCSTALMFFIPIFTDSALIFKLLALFPSFQYELTHRLIIIGFPILMTIPRLIIASLFIKKLSTIFSTYKSLNLVLEFMDDSKLPLIEFILQLTSNSYCSIILLLKAYSLLYGRQEGSAEEIYRSEIMMKRLRMMLKTLASSFLIPVCIQIALVSVVALKSNPDIKEPIQWANTYISLHFAVLATVWSSIEDSTCGKMVNEMTIKEKEASLSFYSQSLKNERIGDHYSSLSQHRQIHNYFPSRLNVKQSVGSLREEQDTIEVIPKAFSLTMQSLAPIKRLPKLPKQSSIFQETIECSEFPSIRF